MLFLHSLFSLAPVILILHCLFIFLFKKWLGPVGTFYASILSFSTVLLCSLNELYSLLVHGNYIFVT